MRRLAKTLCPRLSALSIGLAATASGAAALERGTPSWVVLVIAAALALVAAVLAMPLVEFPTYALLCTLLVPAFGVAFLLSREIPRAPALVLVVGGAAALVLGVWPPRRARESWAPPSSSSPSTPRPS